MPEVPSKLFFADIWTMLMAIDVFHKQKIKE